MKLYAFIEPSEFKAYLANTKTVETEETRSAYLREIGTPGFLFDRVKVGYVEVAPGSCVRLHLKSQETNVSASWLRYVYAMGILLAVVVAFVVGLEVVKNT